VRRDSRADSLRQLVACQAAESVGRQPVGDPQLAQIQGGRRPTARESATGGGIGECALERRREAFCYVLTVVWKDAAQHQPIDLHPYPSHDHPRSSDSLSGRSSFALSACAAASRCAIPTDAFASAARNAALSAMFRMFPPGTFRRASRR
jgi:hypothetical protein